MKLLQRILEGDTDIEHFNILAFNAGAAWVEPKGWLPNTKAGREAALARLDGVLLEGATDLSAALEKLVAPGFAVEKNTPLACFLLSDGHLTWGQTEVAPAGGAASANAVAQPRALLLLPHRAGRGERRAVRGADARRRRRLPVLRRGGGTRRRRGASPAVPADRARAFRGRCRRWRGARGRAARGGLSGRRADRRRAGSRRRARRRCSSKGSFQGQKFSQSFAVEVKDDGELAARGWGEVAVASLLALNDPWVEDLVTAYCQEFNIASRAASFLVLENEARVQALRSGQGEGQDGQGRPGRSTSTTPGRCWRRQSSAKQAFGRLLFQIDARTKVLSGTGGNEVKKLLELLAEEDCALPAGSRAGSDPAARRTADKDYLEARKRTGVRSHPYLTECQRRSNDGDVDGAVRVLSSIIEEHPGRGDALRLVGYRLLDLRQPALAARLFAQVLRQRPFEPHSFRDLARSLEDAGRYPLAALLLRERAGRHLAHPLRRGVEDGDARGARPAAANCRAPGQAEQEPARLLREASGDAGGQRRRRRTCA